MGKLSRCSKDFFFNFFYIYIRRILLCFVTGKNITSVFIRISGEKERERVWSRGEEKIFAICGVYIYIFCFSLRRCRCFVCILRYEYLRLFEIVSWYFATFFPVNNIYILKFPRIGIISESKVDLWKALSSFLDFRNAQNENSF